MVEDLAEGVLLSDNVTIGLSTLDGHLGCFPVLAIIGGKILEFQLAVCISAPTARARLGQESW